MQAEPKKNQDTRPGAASPIGGKRELSGIAFPYADLDTAIIVARDIQQIGGQTCDAEQLAGYWRISATGGNFRARYAPARTFGLLTAEKGRFQLSPLGMRIVDRTQETAARVDAFLQVPLYKAIYEKYRNYQLPGPQALEGEIVRLGVSAKQRDLARQVLIRSARQAGLFWAGEDRLVRPAASAGAPGTMPQQAADHIASDEREQQSRRSFGGPGGGGNEPPRHPLIEGLFQSLPAADSTLTLEEAADWLQAAAYNLRMAYKFKGTITVEASPPKA
ncbi:MAG: hypothetical protein ABL883_15270 [Terricaulis sp.]